MNITPLSIDIISIIKVFGLASVSFVLAILITPPLSHYMYKYKLWRKVVRTRAPDGSGTPLFAELHKDRETRVPRFGGVLIWLTTMLVAGIVWLLSQLTDNPFWDKANFISRNQTWLPLFTMASASILGLVDDFMQVCQRGGY